MSVIEPPAPATVSSPCRSLGGHEIVLYSYLQVKYVPHPMTPRLKLGKPRSANAEQFLTMMSPVTSKRQRRGHDIFFPNE